MLNVESWIRHGKAFFLENSLFVDLWNVEEERAKVHFCTRRHASSTLWMIVQIEHEMHAVFHSCVG